MQLQSGAPGREPIRTGTAAHCGTGAGFCRKSTPGKDYARVTFPERRQREQTATVFGVPSTIAFTLRILGFQVRLVFRLEWDTFCPYTTPFPQILLCHT